MTKMAGHRLLIYAAACCAVAAIVAPAASLGQARGELEESNSSIRMSCGSAPTRTICRSICAGPKHVGKLLPTVPAGLAEFIECVQLHWRRRTFLRIFHFIELNEVTVDNCGGDIADAIMFVVGAVQDKEHAG